MSEPCATTTCKQTSRVLCHCCKKNFCLDHLSSHNNLTDFRSHSLPDQINILYEQMERLNIEKLLNDGRRKLDKWRDDSLKKIDRFYEEKYEELNQYYNQTIRSKQNEMKHLHKNNIINELQTITLDTKQKLDTIEEKGIPIHIRSLTLSNNLITIGELKIKEFDLTNLSSPYQSINYPEKLGLAFASNDRFLLIDQNPFLNFLNSDLTIIHQCLWKYGNISDICWLSILNSFIIITEKSKAFLINSNNFSINSIESMNNQLWISCTSSNSLLYLVSLSNGIVEYTLLPTINYNKRWDPPMTCKQNESIKHISSNQSTIALIIIPFSNEIVYLLIRSLITFNQLFSIRLDIINPLYQLPIRCSTLKNNQWIVIDANTSNIFHIGKDGKMKTTQIYDQPPYNVILFNSNILVIRTENAINFHEIS